MFGGCRKAPKHRIFNPKTETDFEQKQTESTESRPRRQTRNPNLTAKNAENAKVGTHRRGVRDVI